MHHDCKKLLFGCSGFVFHAKLSNQANAANEFWYHFQNCKNFEIPPNRTKVMKNLSNCQRSIFKEIQFCTIPHLLDFVFIQWYAVLYNTASPWFPVLHFFCQIIMAKFAEIRYWDNPMTLKMLHWKIHTDSRELKQSNTRPKAEFWIVFQLEWGGMDFSM